MKSISIFNALGYGIKSYFKYFKYVLFFTIIFGLSIGFIFFIVDFKSIVDLFQYQRLLLFESVSVLNYSVDTFFYFVSTLSNLLSTSSDLQSFDTAHKVYGPSPIIYEMIKASLAASNTLLLIVLGILEMLVSRWISFSLIKLSLKDLNSQNFKFISIFKFKIKLLIRYILALIGYGFIVGISFIFVYILVAVFLGFLNQPEPHIISFGFIVVLFIAALIFGLTIMYSYILAPFVVVDKESSIEDAFSLSKKITFRSRIKIFIFDLLLMLLGVILTAGQFLLLSLIYQHKHYLGNSYIASFLTLAIYSFVSVTFIFIGIFSFTYIYQVLLRNFLIKSKEQLA